ncbi:MAG TPA: hypothetical protein VJV75_03910, partial [Candidatus Polarisedimenticolia bacterium]|nr:hypothetical protein [Candidatus Polarisedimenticolia bacterium]
EVGIDLDAKGDLAAGAPEGVRACARKIGEMALPAARLGLGPGGSVVLFVRLTIAGETVNFRGIDLRRDGERR